MVNIYSKSILQGLSTIHEIEYFQKLSWNTVYITLIIYIFFLSQRSQSRINYHSEQVTINKLSPFQWISPDVKFGTIVQPIHRGGTRAQWTGTQATLYVNQAQ